MSYTTQRKCDICGKDINDAVDTGYVSLSYQNSLHDCRVLESDVCTECIDVLKNALKDFLPKLFKNSTNSVKELDSWFNAESEQNRLMAEEEARVEAEMKAWQEENAKEEDVEEVEND